MAKVNKSKEIRDYVFKHRSASAKEVVEALAKRNIQVTVALVGNVKSKAGLTKARSRTGSREGIKSKTKMRGGADQVNVDALLDAKRLIVKAGSPKKAIEMIHAVELICRSGIDRPGC